MTALSISAGQLVETGSQLFAVDGVTRTVMVTERPLFRDVDRTGAREWETLEVQRFLSRLGFYTASVDGDFGEQTAKATRDYQESIGVERPTTTFQREHVVWAPHDMRVGVVDVQLGQTLAPGDLILTSAPAVSAARVLLDETTVLIPEDGFAYDAALAGDLTLKVQPDGSLDASSLSAEDHLDGQAITVAITADTALLTAPASAVVTSPEGVLCMYLLDAETSTHTPVQIAPRPAQAGLVAFDGSDELVPGRRVLVNPGQLVDRQPC